jgi:hypothetical protein
MFIAIKRKRFQRVYLIKNNNPTLLHEKPKQGTGKEAGMEVRAVRKLLLHVRLHGAGQR